MASNTIAHRVAARYLAAGRLRLGPAKPEPRATEFLRKLKTLPAKNRGDQQSAVVSAAHYARKLGKTMFVYGGNSYMHAVFRVSAKASEYLDPINNTGAVVRSVTPDLEVSSHEVIRSE